MSSQPSLGFIGFSSAKAEVARTLQLHNSSTVIVYDTSAEHVEAGHVQRSDSAHDVAQSSQVTWIEEKDAQSLSESLLGSSGLAHGMFSI